jgi:NAD(P)-dependent dehydrogenase (short-subunit alcohol dehydrogenase family)
MSNPSALWHAARHPPADVTDPALFRNKAVLVTGANSGLGLEAAIKYARLGANPLILGVRTAEKGAAARATIAAASGCSPDVMIVLTLDFSRLRTVADFAAELGKRVTVPLHVVQLVCFESDLELVNYKRRTYYYG